MTFAVLSKWMTFFSKPPGIRRKLAANELDFKHISIEECDMIL
jgi:hypothetical protein